MAASKLAFVYIYDREVNPASVELGLQGLFFAHRLAREGDVNGILNIGDCALHGYMIKPDQAKALNCLGCTAFLGCQKAQMLLSHFAWDATELLAPRTEPAWPF